MFPKNIVVFYNSYIYFVGMVTLHVSILLKKRFFKFKMLISTSLDVYFVLKWTLSGCTCHLLLLLETAKPLWVLLWKEFLIYHVHVDSTFDPYVWYVISWGIIFKNDRTCMRWGLKRFFYISTVSLVSLPCIYNGVLLLYSLVPLDF